MSNNDDIEAISAQEYSAEVIRAQAYQVIGALLDKCGMFESDEGQRALDYFAGDGVDENFLPWPRWDEGDSARLMPVFKASDK